MVRKKIKKTVLIIHDEPTALDIHQVILKPLPPHLNRLL
jgi:hypothetical protein